MGTCTFCSRDISNKGSLAAHEKCCGSNPDRIQHRRGEGAGRQKGCEAPNKGVPNSHIRELWKQWLPTAEMLVANSPTPRKTVRKRILEAGLLEYRCQCCGIGPEWNGKPMPLVMDHINGVPNDHRLENMRFVCSNCDSQLDTYKAKNKKRRVVGGEA